MMPIPITSTNEAPARSSFARDMARDAFGRLGHRFDDQWADHDDISAEQLALKRKNILWCESS